MPVDRWDRATPPSHQDGDMMKNSSRWLLVLSFVYGGVIAVLALLSSPALTIVAVIGALVIGGLWAVRGMFIGGNRAP
jgi:Flp pilus assembly protein TadB